MIDFPKVTYIICNYNYEKYIENSITSVLNQNYPKDKLKICVIDDNSVDNSWGKIHETLFKQNPHHKINIDNTEIAKEGVINDIKVLALKTKKQVGPSQARNLGISHTINDTEIYAILDSDDENYPNKTRRLVAEMLQNSKQIGAVYADYHILNTDNNVKTREFKEPFDRHRLLQNCIVHSGSIVSKYALESVKDENGWYDNELRVCEDYDLWLRISEKWMILHVAEPLSLVRVTPQCSTLAVDENRWNIDRNRVMMKTQKRMLGQ